MGIGEHPKLTRKQAEALAEVCRTNGGGVHVRCTVGEDGYGIPVNPQMRKLHALGLIQGKASGYGTVVHTRDGWALNQWLQNTALAAPCERSNHAGREEL